MWSFIRATIRLSITTSSQKVVPNDRDNDRQPEIAIWPPKPEVLIYLSGNVIGSVSILQLWRVQESAPKWLRQQLTSVRVLFSVTHCQCTLCLCKHGKCQNDILLVCHSNKINVLTKRNSVNIILLSFYVSVWGIFEEKKISADLNPHISVSQSLPHIRAVAIGRHMGKAPPRNACASPADHKRKFKQMIPTSHGDSQ